MKNTRPDEERPWIVRDVSVPLDADCPLWPHSPGVRLDWIKRLAAGDGCNNSVLHCDVHAGTHVDAPLHTLAAGADVASLEPDVFWGPAFVAQCREETRLGPRELTRLGIPSSCRRLLLRTANSRLWKSRDRSFRTDFAALTEEGARWLVSRGLRLIGADYLSVQPFGQEPQVHTILFAGRIVVLEGLDLGDVEEGWWELCCPPLRLSGAEASPVRALLRRPILDGWPNPR